MPAAPSALIRPRVIFAPATGRPWRSRIRPAIGTESSTSRRVRLSSGGLCSSTQSGPSPSAVARTVTVAQGRARWRRQTPLSGRSKRNEPSPSALVLRTGSACACWEPGAIVYTAAPAAGLPSGAENATANGEHLDIGVGLRPGCTAGSCPTIRGAGRNRSVGGSRPHRGQAGGETRERADDHRGRRDRS